MPNNAYLRSTRRERELVTKLKAQGFDACRSAGSHSPWDVWGFNPDTHEVRLIQVKTKKGARSRRIKDVKVYMCVVETSTYSYE